jgi:Ca2+:H+ antiporter
MSTGTDTGPGPATEGPGPARRGARLTRQWTTWVPPVAVVVLAAGWGRALPGPVVAVVGLCLIGSVLSAVHHAEVVAHRVGEPFGSLVLAVAVTVIEVGLIVMLMAGGGDKASTYARDTVFAAVMITCNGVVGLSLLVAAVRRRVAVFNAEGSGGALATVTTLAAMTLVLPTFTTSRPGPQFTGAQLAFAAVASLCLYGIFVTVQTIRHRESFLPVVREGDPAGGEGHAPPPTVRDTWWSLGLLLVALVAVVGNAKLVSPAIEDGVESAGLPHAVVGVVIALMVLLPETLAAVRAASRGRVQTSLNLAYGSAIASIGLTVPAIALASLWLPGPLVLGLGALHLVLLALTAVVSALTVVPGRATLLQGGVHLVLFAAFVFLSVSP